MKTARDLSFRWWLKGRYTLKDIIFLELYCRKVYKELKKEACATCPLYNQSERLYVRKRFERLGFRINESKLKGELFIYF